MKRKFSSNIITPNRENVPNHIGRWFKKPREYEGAGAIVARPGTIVPRVHRDAKVVCKVIWVSDVYFDDNGRSRKDVAFQLCMGPIDGVIRIEAGEDRIPIYNYLGIDDVVSGHQFYKSLEVKTGEFDQTQSLFIENREGDANTPYFPGLAYFVLKGFKLWKWPNRSIPYMEAVILRNIEEASSDVYDDPPTEVQALINIWSSIEFENKIYFTSRQLSVDGGIWNYDPSTDTNTKELSPVVFNLFGKNTFAVNQTDGKLYASSGGATYRRDAGPSWTNITGALGVFDSLEYYNGFVYGLRTLGGKATLYRYDGGTTWTFVANTGSGFMTGISLYNGGDGKLYVGGRGNVGVYEWDGASASFNPLPAFATYSYRIFAMLFGNDNNLYACGNRDSDPTNAIILHRYNGSSWEIFYEGSTTTNSYDLFNFANKIHIVTSSVFQSPFRFEADNSFTQLSVANPGGTTGTNTISKSSVNNKLYAGTNRSLSTVGE